MNLRKWVSNDPERMKRWKEEGFEIHPYKVSDSNEVLKVLGISWDTYQDNLSLGITSLIESLQNGKNTKRFILKTAGKIHSVTKRYMHREEIKLLSRILAGV